MDRSVSRMPLSELNSQHQSGIGMLSEDQQVRFNKLVTKAKELASQGHIKQALDLNKKALAMYNSEKLAKRISKMEAYLAQYGESEEEEEDDGDDMIHVGNNFYLFRDLYDKLYSHQREGILWLWKLHKAKKGGILGDDMGLGKTIQIISFLSGLFDSQQANAVLIVLPVAVIINWEKEFEKWAPGIRVMAFHGTSKRERERALGKIHRRGGVVLTSYGMVISSTQTLREKEGREFVWDYIILDEGHKIKNPSTKGAKCLHSLPARHRIILTGTPVQNNLKEMWSLFDWTHQGTLLGTARTFTMEYEQPIVRARQKDATSGEQRLGQEIAVSLKKIITPYFLRRTKAEVTRNKQRAKAQGENEGDHLAPAMPTFTRKNDLINWVFLSEIQQQIYEEFVQSEDIKDLLNTTRSPLTALVVLKKICDHPRLLNMRQCIELGIDVDARVQNSEDLDEATAKECAANRIQNIDPEVLVSESGKMVFLMELLDNIRMEGHRALVFSQSRKMLDMIQRVLTARGHKVARLDGTIRLLAEREQIIKKFSQDKSYSVFLLTTQVGGVGLTLTAADRVVIFDPSWNPATDAQAVDRAFRIGQDKNVVIYRLITCGSIEEKIYRRQVFKDSITRQTTGDNSNPFRYFSRQELHELFVLDNPRHSATQVQLMEIHRNDKRKTDTRLDAHIAFLHTLEMFGISDHDLMFSRDAHNDECDEDEKEHGNDYINNRVSKAHQAISLESEENYQLTQQLGKYPGPEASQPRIRRPNNDMEGIPDSLRPPGVSTLINVEALHQRSMEMESDDDNINQSMSVLTVDSSPDSSPAKGKNVSTLSEPRSPSPPLSVMKSPLETKLWKNDPKQQMYSDPDTLPTPKSVPQQSREQQSFQDTDNRDIADSEDERNSYTIDNNTPPRYGKRRSDEGCSSDLKIEQGLSNKKGRIVPASPQVQGLDMDDCDMMEIEPLRPRHAKTEVEQEIPVPSELASDQDFQTFPDPDCGSPQSSAQNKENQSTPSMLRKRRPSVCNPNTPHRKFTEDQLKECLNNMAPTGIVTEELDFSPKPTEPIANISRTSETSPGTLSVDMMTLPSFNDTENYEMFAKQVRMNSTVLPDVSRLPPGGRSGASTVITEESEEEDIETGDEAEGDESQIATVKHTRHQRRVVQSSDEEGADIDDGSEADNSYRSEQSSENQSVQGQKEASRGSQIISDDLDDSAADPTEDAEEQQDEDTDEEAAEDQEEVEEEEDTEEEEDEDDEEEEEDEEELSEEDQNQYIALMTKSRELYKAGDLIPALERALDALEIYSGDERAQAYAKKLKKLIMSENSH